MTFTRNQTIGLIVTGVFLVAVGVIAGVSYDEGASNGLPDETGPDPVRFDGVETFTSEDDFRSYLRSAQQSSAYRSGVGGAERLQGRAVVEDQAVATADSDQSPSRHSETNVQERGVAEPDIVKTDGESIFYSRSRYRVSNLTVLDAFPPETLNVSATLSDGGDLFLKDDVLVIIGDDHIRGVDVSTPSSPEPLWNRSLNDSVHTARLKGDTVYVVSEDRADYDNPCPVRPMDAAVIPCGRVYHPSEPVDGETTYSVTGLDLSEGTVDDTVSFLGSSRNTVVYMSQDDVYVTYAQQTSRYDMMFDFLVNEDRGLVEEPVKNRLRRLETYNISDGAKQVELESILEEWQASLSGDDRLKRENELENALRNYTKDNMRRYQRTGIARISIDSFDVEAEGSVPGRVNDQFSLDEYDDTLRVATTVEGTLANVESENDVYTLSEDLSVQGNVTGMGENEQVYSVRFIKDKGYVVTFRRIDPFHVLDLSDPENPSLEGELKLPGFSSYLHPLGEDRILGIGEEDNEVKAVIFDVSDPTNPVTEDSYILDESWSAVNQNHHAFLQDEKHDVFFLPASQGGYVFSYKDGLDLVKAVDMKGVERAVYIDDYLYVLGEEEVVVLDQQTWDRVNSVELGSLPNRDYPVRTVEPREPVLR